MVLQQREAEAVLKIHIHGLLSHGVNLHQRAVGVVNHHVALRAAAQQQTGKNTHRYLVTLAGLDFQKKRCSHWIFTSVEDLVMRVGSSASF